MADPCDSLLSPEALAAGVLILHLKYLPSVIPIDKWVPLPADIHESLENNVFLDPDQWNILELVSDLCHAGFIATSMRGRSLDVASSEGTLQLYLRIYLISVSVENGKRQLEDFHTRDLRDTPRKLNPRVALQTILSLTIRDPMAWQCLGTGNRLAGSMFFEQYSDNRSLSEIFDDLPSPLLPPPTAELPDEDPDRLLCEALVWSAPPGMRSTLYPYQRRTVWSMLAQELRPGTWADPRYVRVESMDDSRAWFLNPYTCEVRTETDVTYDRVKGGILCEEMGSGKTCMCIALCLATKGRVVSPPSSPHASTAVTMDAMSWPGVEDRLPYNTIPRPLRMEEEASTNTFPSLRQLSQYVASTSSSGLSRALAQVRSHGNPQRAAHFQRVMERLALEAEAAEQREPGSTLPFYLESEEDGARRATRDARRVLQPARRVWLSALTLILVPSMIFQQWNSEFLKHCEDDVLRILSVPSSPVHDLPNAEFLVQQYDVVLMTHERFSAEAMPASGRRSPLLDIRFQRLIIDEGHVTNSDVSRLKDLGTRLSVESRWVVTGTPTKNIKGLRMGTGKRRAKALPGADLVSSRSEMLLAENASDAHAQNSWSRTRNGDDLKRLGNMFAFLKVPPFLGQDADWNSTIIRPLLNPRGAEFGAVQRLLRCLEGVMIRHRAEDIEQDVPLPELKHELVVLDMTEHCALTHNAVLAQIAINAIDSERKDQDYLFHPKNRTSLGVVINNLSQSLFWHTDNETDYAERVRTAIKSKATAEKRGASADDIHLIDQSIQHLSKARDHNEWSTIMDRIWLPYEVTGLPVAIHSWIRSPTLRRPDGSCLIEPERLTHIRGYAGLHQRDMQENQLEELSNLGTVYNLFDEELSQYVESMKQFKQAKQKSKKRLSSPMEGGLGEVDAVMAVQTSSTTPASPSKSSRTKIHGKKEPPPPVLADPRFEAFRKAYPRDVYNAGFSTDTFLAQAKIGRSLSNKVNYILSDVLRYSPTEKIIIFSSSSLSLSHLTEAFEVYRIRFLHFHNALSVKERENTIKTFETSDTFRVLLMELKHGARGLNLVSASRVYFCEPVWRADEESQAIKRCHRIGQTRDVIVKTLVIRGTAEEEAVRVRNSYPNDQTRQMVDDVSIKQFVEYPQFLMGTSMEWPTLSTGLLRARDADEDATGSARSTYFAPASPKRSKKRVRVEDAPETAELETTGLAAPPRKKQKQRARFEDESPPSSLSAVNVPDGHSGRFAEHGQLTPPATPKVHTAARKKGVTFASSPDEMSKAIDRTDDSVPQGALMSPLSLRVKIRLTSRAPQASTSTTIARLSSPADELSTSPRSRDSTPPPITPSSGSSIVGFGEGATSKALLSGPLRSSLKRARPDEDIDDLQEPPVPKRARFGHPTIATLEDVEDVEIDELADE